MKVNAERLGDMGEAGSPRQRVAMLLRDNGHLFRQEFRRRLKALEVTAAEARALMYLRLNEGIAQGRLAEVLEVQPIALTRVIDRLAEGGWVERRFSETDRRLRLLVLTPSGRTLVRRLHRLNDELNLEITAALDTCELERLAEHLERINAALRQMK